MRPDLAIVPLPADLVVEPEWAGEVDRVVDEYAAEGVDPIPEAAHIPTTKAHAEWAMRKLAALLVKQNETAVQAAEWRAQIDEWADAELARVKPHVAYFEDMLERFGIAWRREHPDEATVRLPSGEIATTQPKTPKVVVMNEAAVIAWAKDAIDEDNGRDAVVKVTESLLTSGLREVVDVQRRLIPFCSICGESLMPTTEGDGDERRDGWAHGPSPDPEVHDHEPEPGSMWEVLRDGAPVPGLAAELGDITARVKPTR